MKREIAELWAEDLRAHPDLQGRSALHVDGRFCCLGRLCELAIEAGVPVKVTLEPHGPSRNCVTYDDNTIDLPEQVQRWAGARLQDPNFGFKPRDEVLDVTCCRANDAIGLTFPQIADLILARSEYL